MSDERPVPDIYLRIADQLSLVASTLATYMRTDPKPWPECVAARERVREQEFAELPYEHPVAHAHVAPIQYLTSSQDHLQALAAALRTPDVVLALLTLLRTQLVAAAFAIHLTDPLIGLRERIRRSLNADLQSLTEKMFLAGRGDAEAVAWYDDLERRRVEIKAAAHKLGWVVKGEQTPKRTARPKVWGIEPIATEMGLIDAIFADNDDKIGLTLYRLLSASSHAQPHGLAFLIDRDNVTSLGDGTAFGRAALSHEMATMFALSATTAVTLAVSNGVQFYGWPAEQWKTTVVPIVDELREILGVPRSPLLI